MEERKKITEDPGQIAKSTNSLVRATWVLAIATVISAGVVGFTVWNGVKEIEGQLDANRIAEEANDDTKKQLANFSTQLDNCPTEQVAGTEDKWRLDVGNCDFLHIVAMNTGKIPLTAEVVVDFGSEGCKRKIQVRGLSPGKSKKFSVDVEDCITGSSVTPKGVKEFSLTSFYEPLATTER